jgi:antitoxin component YwqK of YwqJK toxin-antitoxin module
MQKYIATDLIKYVISDYVNYYALIQIPILQCNKHRISEKPDKIKFRFLFNGTSVIIDDVPVFFTGISKEHYSITLSTNRSNSYGEITQYYPNRNIHLYSIGESSDNCFKKFYYYNGALMSIGHYKNGTTDMLDGTKLVWHQNSVLAERRYYDRGNEEGTTTLYYDNGQCKEIYTNDVFFGKTGWHYKYDETGKCLLSDFYIKGKKQNKLLLTLKNMLHKIKK